MKSSIEKLYQISQKKTRRIIGLMSGTSLDGLDIAICRVSDSGKETKILLEEFISIPYENSFKNNLNTLLSNQHNSLQNICLMHTYIGEKHAAMVNQFLKEKKITSDEIDLLASHGQTIFHAPKTFHQLNEFSNSTLQIGDGDHLAVKTGIITISDFRQKHVAAGGEGAPLVTYGDYLLFSHSHSNRIILNIGGIANLTFLPANGTFKEIISTDIGPGNILMDKWIQHHHQEIHFDKHGEIASRGTINQSLLNTLASSPFFKLRIPKTTGGELFNLSFIQKALKNQSNPNLRMEDVMATLSAFTANTIIKTIQEISKDAEIFISGGGVHNTFLMTHLKNGLPNYTWKSLEFNSDAKEAVLFAVLANEAVAGNKMSFEGGTSHHPNIGMGKISFPH